MSQTLIAGHSESFEYWLVGLPGRTSNADRHNVDAWAKVEEISKKYSENYVVTMPDLRVGTLDQLLTASVDLERLEATVDGVLSKVISALMDVLDIKIDNMDEFFTVHGTPLPEFLSKFQWDLARFSTRQTMKLIQDQIEKQMAAIDAETKTHFGEYAAARAELALIEKYQKGPILTRNVSEFVRKEDFVLESEHLITVLVVVPRNGYGEWYGSYERLDNEVVPRSTSLLHEDSDYGLFNVTLFKRHLDKFREKAKERRFFVKDFEYNEERIRDERDHLTELRYKKANLISPLIRSLRSDFSEVYTSYVHVKMMRVFVESVLRYGLPADFLGILMVVPKRNVKRLRELMFRQFAYLDGSLPKEERDDKHMPTDYLPYVCIKVNVEPTDFRF